MSNGRNGRKFCGILNGPYLTHSLMLQGTVRGEQQSGPQFPSTKWREQRDQICNVLNSGLPKGFVSMMSNTDYTDSQKWLGS